MSSQPAEGAPHHVGAALPPPWLPALSLRERAATPSHAARGAGVHDGSVDASAQRRFEKWRAQPPFNGDDAALAERLAWDGLTPDRLVRMIGDAPNGHTRSLKDRVPAWCRELEHAYPASAPRPIPDWASEVRSETSAEGTGTTGAEDFLVLLEPLVERGLRRVRAGMAEAAARLPLEVAGDALERDLLRALRRDLSVLVGRTMALELNVARLEGRLTAPGPRERFGEFSTSMKDPRRARAVLAEYPVLARQAVIRIDQWAGSTLDLLSNLAADWSTIRTALGISDDTTALVGATPGMGDRHAGGRTVTALVFDSGARIVYKPRSMSVDVHFQEFLEWMNTRGNGPRFRVLRVLDRGDHGWVEFVEPHACTSSEEVGEFYRRQGGLLALLHVLHAVDFHFENIIAAGSDPVLVDLETLFHPNHWTVGTASAAPANAALGESVLQTGLLPRRRYLAGDEQDTGTETSGIGGPTGEEVPFPVPRWEDSGTDKMRVELGRQVIAGGDNRPVVDGTAVDPLTHLEDVVSGFTDTYRTLVQDRGHLLAPQGPIERFSADQVRFIARPTTIYARTLAESYHPDVLRDALERDRLFDRIWIGRGRDAVRAALFAAERRDLEHGDIPLFVMRPTARHLWDSQGSRLPNLLDRAVMESVRERVQGLGEADLAWQTWLIRASFTALTIDENDAAARPVRTVRPARRAASPDELITAAKAVGDRLEYLALADSDTVDWIGINFVNERTWALGPTGPDLYFGQWGIALALGYLGAVSGEDRYTALARRVVGHLRRHGPLAERAADGGPTRSADPVGGIGAFHPGPSAVFVLTHLGTLWHDRGMLEDGSRLADQLAAAVAEDKSFDVLSGTAGFLTVVLGLYSCTRDQHLLQHAAACGDHLLANATPVGDGLAWHEPRFGGRPLAGFSHGASGVAHALLRLGEATGDRRFAAAAEQAMAYERGLFSLRHGNWPDLREAQQPERVTPGGEPPYMTAWCHGAPGIGLARATALGGGVGGDAVLRELDTAFKTTRERLRYQDDSLCHGTLGNLDAIQSMASALGVRGHRTDTMELAAGLLDDVAHTGWRCGTPGGVESPGLMTGLAGICQGLVRLAAPHRVPSVLTLSPPLVRVGPSTTSDLGSGHGAERTSP